MNDKKPIEELVLLDWADFTCPCGSMFRYGASTEFNTMKDWFREHKEHSDGTCHCVSDAAASLKVMSSVPEPYTYAIEY